MTTMELIAAGIGMGILATITFGFWLATHR
jgi:hypothetical protein